MCNINFICYRFKYSVTHLRSVVSCLRIDVGRLDFYLIYYILLYFDIVMKCKFTINGQKKHVYLCYLCLWPSYILTLICDSRRTNLPWLYYGYQPGSASRILQNEPLPVGFSFKGTQKVNGLDSQHIVSISINVVIFTNLPLTFRTLILSCGLLFIQCVGSFWGGKALVEETSR